MRAFSHRLQDCAEHQDPFLVQALLRGKQAGVVRDRHVVIDGHRLAFLEAPLPEETSVWVGLDRDGYYAQTAAAVAQCAAEAQAAEAQQAADLERRRQDRQAQARAFHARYALPFRWTVGIKDRLSGLGARSAGDGCARNTVQHLRVLEALHQGRLSRRAGDFLCTSAQGTNGQQWVDPPPLQDPPAVTCPRCRALMARWQKPSV